MILSQFYWFSFGIFKQKICHKTQNKALIIWIVNNNDKTNPTFDWMSRVLAGIEYRLQLRSHTITYMQISYSIHMCCKRLPKKETYMAWNPTKTITMKNEPYILCKPSFHECIRFPSVKKQIEANRLLLLLVVVAAVNFALLFEYEQHKKGLSSSLSLLAITKVDNQMYIHDAWE